MGIIGIRREDKNRWERRVPLIPDHIKLFKEQYNITTYIQPSAIRAYSDKEFLDSEAIIQEDLSNCPVVFAVKEIPIPFFEPKKTYVFFSHTSKGQTYNMPMLKQLMDLKCTLIDYEKIIDNAGRRLVFFGRFAGLAGMVDTLWAYGQRLKSQQSTTPFSQIKQAAFYKNLTEIKETFHHLGIQIRNEGFPKEIVPVVIGFAGYGNVSKGAQEIIDLFPTKTVNPKDLPKIYKNPSRNHVYKVVFKEEDIVEPRTSQPSFNVQEYYTHPENYQSQFESYLPYLTILMNCIYWNKQYPRLVTKDYVHKNYKKDSHLQVIGDISVDINGAIEITEKTTSTDNPIFIYNAKTGTITDDITSEGIMVMAVDNLPCELPRGSSRAFSKALYSFIPAITKADYTKPFTDLNLPAEIKKAVIVYHGKLTKEYQYIDKYL